jgi:hypothetical protein
LNCACAVAIALALVAVSGCTTVPAGPTLPALPGSGKTLEQFQRDDAECQRYANVQASLPVAAGVAAAPYDVQRRYDFAYVQCMYSNGHKVPVPGAYTAAPTGQAPPESFAAPPAQAPPAAAAPK